PTRRSSDLTTSTTCPPAGPSLQRSSNAKVWRPHPVVEVVGARTRARTSHVHGLCVSAHGDERQSSGKPRTRTKHFRQRAQESSPHRPTRSMPTRVDTTVRSPSWAEPFDGCPRPRHRGRGRVARSRTPTEK